MVDESRPRRVEALNSGLAFERPILELEQKIAELEKLAASTRLDLNGEIKLLRERLKRTIEETYRHLTPWERVNVARHADRPITQDYIEQMLDDFFELHGDGYFGDDRAMVTGMGKIGGRSVMLVAHRKGKTTKERLACNFGCAHPEGYRKALRKMKLAERLRLPIVALINTPGAYPGIGAEERGQARAIAENILEMFGLATPILSIVIGEGGSGGALGIGVGDKVAILQHAYYSVISPEACSAILWRNGERAPDAARALRLTSDDLLALGVVDEVIPEPLGGAHRDPPAMIAAVKQRVLAWLDELSAFSTTELLDRRYRKFRYIAQGVLAPPPL
ncbi:MAG: acetyl-CoA carboxylase carboxyltransferase subunit alpha [Planctomycetes bacterium]|nr:acetyl-CoA carboxylase carboxyltransferase subunit alpha [Planctomycetota bacterium]